jgi:hypothetical protein
MVKKSSPVVPAPTIMSEKIENLVKDSPADKSPKADKADKSPADKSPADKSPKATSPKSSPKKSPVKAIPLNPMFDFISELLKENDIITDVPSNEELHEKMKIHGLDLRNLYDTDVSDEVLLSYKDIILTHIFPPSKKSPGKNIPCAYFKPCKTHASCMKDTEVGKLSFCKPHGRAVKEIPKSKISQDALDNPEKYTL